MPRSVHDPFTWKSTPGLHNARCPNRTRIRAADPPAGRAGDVDAVDTPRRPGHPALGALTWQYS
ncbi:hypothetical protein [Phytoactinopolyspora limicola]|uniref:hypothetical protein n=1 Tax=Phytoactinopolyspora limicola TaxID=2715536 RepID=UPI0014077F65|nr:hypothetical protein [Phytoactinopolyspora limicola]